MWGSGTGAAAVRAEEADHGVLVGDEEILEAEAHEARAAGGSGRRWSFGEAMEMQRRRSRAAGGGLE